MVAKIVVLAFAALVLKAQSQVCNSGSPKQPFQGPGLPSNINACVTPIPPSRNRLNNIVAETTSSDCSCNPSNLPQAYFSNLASCSSRSNSIETVGDCSNKQSNYIQSLSQNPSSCNSQVSRNKLTGPATSLLDTFALTSSCGAKPPSLPKPRLPNTVSSFGSVPESNCIPKPGLPNVILENGITNSFVNSLPFFISNDGIENTFDCIPRLSTANAINAFTDTSGYSTASCDSIATESQSSNPFASRCSTLGSNFNIFRNNLRPTSCSVLPKVGITENITPCPVDSFRPISVPISFNNLVGPTTSTAISEAVSSANTQTTGLRPFSFGPQNNIASSSQAVSIAEANAVSIDSSNPFTSNGLGSFSSFNPSSSAVSLAEATSSVNIEPSLPTNPYYFGGFNNLPTPFLPTSNFPGINRPSFYGYPEAIRPTSAQAVSIAEANAVSIDSSNSLSSNGFGVNPSSTSLSVAEATSSVNIDTSVPTSPYSRGVSNNLPTPFSPTLSFPGPGFCGYPQPIKPTSSTSTQTVSIAEANAVSIDSSNSLSSNGFGINPSSTSVSVAEATSSVNVDTNPSVPTNPYSSGCFNNFQTPFLPSFQGINRPSFCGYPQAIRPASSASAQAVSIAEANAVSVDSSNSLSPNSFGVNPTSTAVSVSEATSSVNIEPSLSANPYSFGGLNNLPTPFLPANGFAGLNSQSFYGFPEPIRPSPCETPYLAYSQQIPYPPFSPMSSSLYESPNVLNSFNPLVPPCFGSPQMLPMLSQPSCGTTEVTSTSTSAVAVAESSSSAVSDVSSGTSVSIAESSASAVSVDPVVEEIATPIVFEDKPLIEEVVLEVASLPVIPQTPTILPSFEASPIVLEVAIPTYELYIPSSIPAQMACTVGNIPSYGCYC